MKKNKSVLLTAPYILWMVVFTLIPLGVVLNRTELFLFFIGILRQLIVLSGVGAVVAKHTRVFTLVHDVDVLGIQPDTDGGTNGVEIRGLDQPLEAPEIDDDVVV